MKNILLILSIFFLSFDCLSQSIKETIIDTIYSRVKIINIDYNVKCTKIEGEVIYKGKEIKVYNNAFDGYYLDYDLAPDTFIERKVFIFKQVINNQTTILGRTSYSDLISLGE